MTYFEGFSFLNTDYIRKSITLMFKLRVPREKNSRFRSKTRRQMFLFVLSGSPYGAHSDGHQHGFSIQSSINFGLYPLKVLISIFEGVTLKTSNMFYNLLHGLKPCTNIINF